MKKEFYVSILLFVKLLWNYIIRLILYSCEIYWKIFFNYYYLPILI